MRTFSAKCRLKKAHGENYFHSGKNKTYVPLESAEEAIGKLSSWLRVFWLAKVLLV